LAHDYQIILFGALLVCASIVATAVSARFGVPLLLVFLVVGMLVGEDGPGGVHFDDLGMAQFVGSIALAIIIFDGGLRTRRETLRLALWPAVSLATVGVIVTALIVAAAVRWLTGLDWLPALLVGSIIGSTDAAAVFGLLNTAGTQIKRRVAATLEVESASNDPMAIFLTLALVGVLASGGQRLSLGLLTEFFRQFGIGTAAGIGGGFALAALVNRLHLLPAFYALLVAAGGMLVFAVASLLGGSGFLAIYVAGVVLGNVRLRAYRDILRVHDGLAWLAQIVMFLMLGLLVAPHELMGIVCAGIGVALALILVARPVAVALCLLPFRFPWREQVFVSWVGLRGAVPMILAIFPMTAGLPDARLFFNIAFFVVLTSLLVQGWTIVRAARALRLEVPPGNEPLRRLDLDLPGRIERAVVSYRVPRTSAGSRLVLSDLPLGSDSRVLALVRNDALMPVAPDVALMPDDLLHVFAEPDVIDALGRLFDPRPLPPRLVERRFFGDFVLQADAPVEDVAALYGLTLPERAQGRTLGEYFRAVFHGRPVVGDRIGLGHAELVVRQVEDGQITQVGLRIPPADANAA
jgi:cell volume regulation protein A